MWEPPTPYLAQFMPIVTQLPSILESTHQLPVSQPPSPSTCGRISRMTRGRKKDLTIPPTRALVQQRDYRARRAQYVSDLEDRCRRVEEENTRLRNDLAAVRTGQATPAMTFNPQTAQASSELMHTLSVASASLARFQQLAFADPPTAASARPLPVSSNQRSSQHPDKIPNVLRPASFPSPAPSPPYGYSTSNSSATRDYNPPRRKRLHREDSPHSIMSQSEDLAFSRRSSMSPSIGSDCCGGIMDCRDLVERDDVDESDDSSASRKSLPQVSGGSAPSSRHGAYRKY